MPKKIDKAYFTTVVVLRGSCKPVYVRERPDKVVLTSEEVVVKHVQACSCAREDRESSFHSMFMCVKDLITPF